ncbi:CAF17-like 4Fe-4S cluster assembly/insertion protein YgfZ [Jongsikchunia kroppenstedtii]|uniref:CAF17-like 4Fe-4S cluster assembly/insertion protein YgfZ n=1 Tax=Jongsikchunia kroppenstedtii TaxID=1121721 RepID=UPI0003A6D7A1|nr:folate-binding protein [Jongsikchunia kroppenstedtii]
MTLLSVLRGSGPENQSGAVGGPADSPDADVAWHFGDPLGEQRTAARTAAIIDRSHRRILALTGPERLSWLHTISSQDVAELPDGTSAENLSLDGNGRVEDHFVLTDLDGVTWIDTEAARADELLAFLQKMVFWAKVEPVDRPDMALLSVVGPAARTGAVATLLGVPAEAVVYQAGSLDGDKFEGGGFWRIMPPLGEAHDVPAIDIVVSTDQLRTWWDRLTAAGAAPAGMWTYEALRVAALRPRLGLDTDERTIPQEARWIGSPAEQGAVHLNKGCYRGQETVARVHNLGKSPRQLVLLHVDGSSDTRPVTGDPVTADGRAVGRVGTVIDHFENGPIALALIKRAVPADTALEAGGAAVSIDPATLETDAAVPAGRRAQQQLRNG